VTWRAMPARPDAEDDSIEPLLLGRICSYYYLQHPSVALFASNLGRVTKFGILD